MLAKPVISGVLLLASNFSTASDNDPCAEGSPYFDEPLCDQKIEKILEEDRSDPRLREPKPGVFVEDLDRVGSLNQPLTFG